MSEPLLDVEGLAVSFGAPSAARTVVADVSFQLRSGEVLGVNMTNLVCNNCQHFIVAQPFNQL